MIRRAGLSADFEFTGALEGEARDRAYRNADLFVLPSHTENFGMAVAEALAHGLPVITTRATPWRGLETRHCGWYTDVDAGGLSLALREATSLADDVRRAMGRRGRVWVEAEFGWASIADRMILVYQEVCAFAAEHSRTPDVRTANRPH